MAILFSTYFLLCALSGYLGRERSMGFLGFFVLAILLTPVVIIIILMMSAPRKTVT